MPNVLSLLLSGSRLKFAFAFFTECLDGNNEIQHHATDAESLYASSGLTGANC